MKIEPFHTLYSGDFMHQPRRKGRVIQYHRTAYKILGVEVSRRNTLCIIVATYQRAKSFTIQSLWFRPCQLPSPGTSPVIQRDASRPHQCICAALQVPPPKSPPGHDIYESQISYHMRILRNTVEYAHLSSKLSAK